MASLVGFVGCGGSSGLRVKRVRAVCANSTRCGAGLARTSRARFAMSKESSSDELEIVENLKGSVSGTAAIASTALLTTLVGAPAKVAAADDALGMLFKTTPATLMHPLWMWVLFAGSVYAFYLGLQARTLRTTDDRPKKKELAEKRPGSKHFATASSIMAIMTIFTFEGMANTFNRAGKLFPGPHLYNGLGLVALMTVMAALVPEMQKPASTSNSTAARNAHFGLAFGALFLFAWQAQTGMDIVAKILKW
mmetsp:Transcript_3841/g.8460  ORF Transcript_3841/g.8460 Transcript_3841/m.8460 type:complete len:251 (-) Transcript_3841:49-801(-)